VPATPLDGVADKLLFPVRSAQAAGRVLDVVRAFRPHVIVGLGGFRSIVPVLLGRALGIRTVLFESNALAGRAVRLLAPAVDVMVLQWEQAAAGLVSRRILVAGNPIRAKLFGVRKEAAVRRLGLSPLRRTLLVLGGSQGALALNRTLQLALSMIYAKRDDLQVLHLTGVDHLAAALEWMNSLPVTSYRPIGFLNQMEDAYAAADFVLSRCGGSTLAELTALGLPAILVPYPYDAGRHQHANADVLARAGAAVVIEQSGLTAQRLADAVVTLTADARLRAQMADASRRLGRPHAALTVAAEIARMAGAGGQLAGLLGMLLAVPVAGTLKTLAAEFLLPEVRRLAGRSAGGVVPPTPADGSDVPRAGA
jgi:UDP-N-acetylglucosamine--N-acetylmuramyl-(pentapeptide) pyrophosphoryl-undecaprenol N-acetylglucosamine transferase